jgi:hypothetical protein
MRLIGLFVAAMLLSIFLPAKLSAQPQTFFYRAWTQTGGAVSPGFINRVVSIAGSGGVTYTASSVLISTNNYGLRLTQYSSGGTTNWVANFNLGAGGTTHVGGIALDASGNVLVTGSAYNGSTNGHDLYLVKYNSSGTKQWHQTYSGTGTGTDAGSAVICNASGDIFVTGVASQTFPNTDALTLCYASNGTLVWNKTWDNASLVDVGATLSLLGTRVFITGASQTNFNTWEYAVIRYEQSNGSFVSATVTSAGGTNIELVSAATLDAAGNVYLTGALGVSGQGFNIKTIKLSPSLAILWTANWNGAANLDDAGRSIVVDTAGNVFVAGYTTASDRDGVLLKYTSSGSLLYATSNAATGAGEFTGLALSSAQEPFVGGYTSERGNKDFLAQLYTNGGTLQWSDTYNGYANEDDVVQQVTSLSSGNFLLSGTSGTSTLAVKYNRHALLLPLEEEVNAPFIENRGQVMNTDTTPQDDVRYYTRSNYPNTYIFDDQVSFVFAHIDTVASSQDTMTRLDLRFINETSTVAVGLERQEDFHNYYLGHIPEGRERVPLENKVLHPNIYTNIDALYGQGQDGFFARFVCKPGSTPGQIRLLFRGHTGLSIQTDGSLRVETALEDLILAPPTAIFSDASGTESAAGWAPAFVLSTDSTVRFSVGTVPSGSSLIIKTGRERYDPENECDYYWSTYFGETGDEDVKGSDVDVTGNMYFTGRTNSALFPTTTGAYSELLKGNWDAFAARFRQLDEQEWATFYGGTDVNPSGFPGDEALAIKWNPNNNHIYFIGRTPASDFPLLQATGYFDDQKAAVWDTRGFIVKLDAFTGERRWATFFGDSEKRYDAVTALHIRQNGNVVVGGYAQQAGNNQTAFPFFPTNIPSTIPHIQTTGALYIAEFNPSNFQVWATKLANELQLASSPILADITENSGGALMVVGTVSADDTNDFIPLGPGSMAFSGGFDAFFMDFSLLKELRFSTYLGGNDFDFANSVVSTIYGTFITGTTQSTDFPTIASGNPGDPLLNDLTLDGSSDIFISQFQNDDSGGKTLTWSRYLGGSGGLSGADEQGNISHNFQSDFSSVGNAAISLNQKEIAVTGRVSNGFSPLTASGCPYYYGSINRGGSQTGQDAILVIIENRRISFSTYWGGDTPNGTGADEGTTISTGVNLNDKAFVLLGGRTNSKKISGQGETIPVCRELPFPGSYYKENFLGGANDAFISKIYYGECLTSAVTSPLDQIWTLDIQPNPAIDNISIMLPVQDMNGATILLFDATGRVVANISRLSNLAVESAIAVDVSLLQSGIYFVTLQSSGRTYSGKFVKM